MNWKYVMAAACFIGALLAGGCGKPSVHVMAVKMEKVPFAMETRVVPEALHIAPVIPSVSGGLISGLPEVGQTVEAGRYSSKLIRPSMNHRLPHCRHKFLLLHPWCTARLLPWMITV